MSTLKELELGDAKICILTDGEDIADIKVLTAEQLEDESKRAEKWTCGNLYWIVYEPKTAVHTA